MSRFNTSVSLIAVTLLMLYTTIYAQDSVSVRGKYALQFQIASDFQLASFNGATISGKYTLPDENAVRVGFDINGLNNIYNENTNNAPQSNSAGTKDTRKSYSFNITLLAQYLFYNKVVNDVAFYYGGGPLAGLSYSKINETPLNYYNSNSSEDITNKWTVGISLVCGVDWFLNKTISLSAEYGLSVSYYKAVENIIVASTSTSQNANYGYQFGANSVKLGLSIYF